MRAASRSRALSRSAGSPSRARTSFVWRTMSASVTDAAPLAGLGDGPVVLPPGGHVLESVLGSAALAPQPARRTTEQQRAEARMPRLFAERGPSNGSAVTDDP